MILHWFMVVILFAGTIAVAFWLHEESKALWKRQEREIALERLAEAQDRAYAAFGGAGAAMASFADSLRRLDEAFGQFDLAEMSDTAQDVVDGMEGGG